MIAALYVAKGGPYFGLPDVDPWDEARDARRYAGPWPVVAHPPCERWGRYATGGPNPRARRREVGDDAGCFAAALNAVEAYGGVLEHPAATKAFAHFGLDRPPLAGGWARSRAGWVCHVEQGQYGHPARKATWLYAVGPKPPELLWGPCGPRMRLDPGYHSAEEARAARASGAKPPPRLTAAERIHTPLAFRDALIEIARSAR